MGLRTWTCKKILPYVLQRVYHDGMLDSVNAFVKAQKEGLMVHEMIYHPKKTHSTFYLPLALSDEIQQFVFMNDDYYEVEQLDHIFHRFHEGEIAKKIQGKTVLDIGANIGNHTLYFMNEIMLGNGKCICFEVMPETVKILQKNIELNHLEDRVTVNSFGLSDRDMHASPSHGYNLRNIGANPIQEDAAGTLEVRALDSLQLSDDVALVKIDVEGMELAVLKGGRELLERCHPYVIVESFPDAFDGVRGFMEDLGYREERLTEVDHLFYHL